MGLNKYALGHNKQANMQYYLYLPFYLNIKCILMYFCTSIVSAVFEKSKVHVQGNPGVWRKREPAKNQTSNKAQWQGTKIVN